MKTMTKAEFKNFVMSGYFPTSNEDIADLQDIFGHLPYRYHISLLICEETKDNMITLCNKLLNPNDFNHIVKRATDLAEELARKKELEAKIAEMEKELKAINNSTSAVSGYLHQIEVEVFD